MTTETEAQSSSRAFDTSLLTPPPSYTVPSMPELNAAQQIKLKEIELHFSKEAFELPVMEGTTGDPEKRGLSEREMMFLSRETFLRFLIATKSEVAEAIKRLEACVAWRRSVKIDDVQAMADDCEPESKTGKNIVMGFSPQCRPIMYFFPNRNLTPVNERRVVHSIFLLERARDLFPAGVTNVLVVFNFAGKREGPPSSVSNARQLLHILGQHYPETLSLSFFQDLHWIIKTFINLMWPFVDPNTKKKVKFGSVEVGELTRDKDVEPGQLLKECGGDLDIPYRHEEYWTPMVKTCLDIRAKQEEAFRALGPPKVGREEKSWRAGRGVEVSSAANGTEKPVSVAEAPLEPATTASVPAPPMEGTPIAATA